MPTYHLRLAVEVADDQEREMRLEKGLTPDVSLLPALREEMWEVVTAGGTETGHWGRVAVT